MGITGVTRTMWFKRVISILSPPDLQVNRKPHTLENPWFCTHKNWGGPFGRDVQGVVRTFWGVGLTLDGGCSKNFPYELESILPRYLMDMGSLCGKH